MSTNLVETQIGYSTKISKQVLLSNYRERLAHLIAEEMKQEEVMKNIRRSFSGFITAIENKAKDMYLQCPIAVAMNTVIELAEAERCKERSELTTDAHQTIIMLDPRETNFSIEGRTHNIKQAIETGKVSICVHDEFQNATTNNFAYMVEEIIDAELPVQRVKQLQEMLNAYEAQGKIMSDKHGIMRKIEGIDAHMERIEAELLVKELQKTDSGQQVLELTQAILIEEEGVGLPMLEAK